MSNHTERTLSDRTFTAATWTIAGKLLARSIDFVLLIILARLLSPADFGLVAMAMTAVVIAEAVLELPLLQILIGISEPTKPMFDTAFTLSILRGLAIALVLATLSWPISWLYGDTRLPLLICALSLAPILRGSQSPRLVVFLKRMDFRRDFAMNVAGKLAALIISTTVAYETGSYWAIALGTIATPSAINLLSYWFAPYAPSFTLSEWPLFANTVGWNSASQFMVAISWQIDRIMLGRFVPQATFGRFALASDLSGIPSQALIAPITAPLLAAFAPQAGLSSLGEAYCKASNAVVFIAAPVLVVMTVLADPLIRLGLGNGWLEAAPLLRWLSFIALLALPTAPMSSLALATGRMSTVTLRTAIELILKIPVTLAAIVYDGVMGAVIARGVVAFVVVIVSMRLVSRLTQVSFTKQLMALWRTTVALSAMAICLAIPSIAFEADLNQLQLGFYLVAASLAAGLVYMAVLFGLWRACGRPSGIENTVVRTLKRFAIQYG